MTCLDQTLDNRLLPSHTSLAWLLGIHSTEFAMATFSCVVLSAMLDVMSQITVSFSVFPWKIVVDMENRGDWILALSFFCDF